MSTADANNNRFTNDSFFHHYRRIEIELRKGEEEVVMLNRRIISTFFPLISSLIRMSSSSSTTIHSASIDDIYNIPMKDIIRPLPSVLDENKVQSLMETIQVEI